MSIYWKTAVKVLLIILLLSLGAIARSEASGNKEVKIAEFHRKYIENEVEELPPFPKGNPFPPKEEKKQPRYRLTNKKPVQSIYAGSMSEKQALAWIISQEGGATSVNRVSLACGLPQSKPCSKLLTFAGVDLDRYDLTTYNGVKAAISTVPAETQRAWMIRYCQQRYGSVAKAVAFWRVNHWY